MYEVNRSVFIVIPNEPFWYWLNSLPDSDLSGITLEDLQDDANSYLVDACENADALWEEIENRVEEMFDIELSSIVTDLSSEPLQREAFGAIEFD